MRGREEVIRDFVRQWLNKAEGDLTAAEILLASETHDYFPCAFHCQQAYAGCNACAAGRPLNWLMYRL